MAEINYKVKIRTFYDSYDDPEESEFELSIPTNVVNIERFISYICNSTKKKGQMIQILDYEECE